MAATANASAYAGATPTFADEPGIWQMEPDLVEQAIRDRVCCGQCPDLLSSNHGQVRQRHHGRTTSTFGDVGLFSFNSNKINTTSDSGGILVTREPDRAAHTRHLATQCRDPAPQ